jgi:hypothetical protein
VIPATDDAVDRLHFAFELMHVEKVGSDLVLDGVSLIHPTLDQGTPFTLVWRGQPPIEGDRAALTLLQEWTERSERIDAAFVGGRGEGVLTLNVDDVAIAFAT